MKPNELLERIGDWVEEHREDAVELARELVKIPSENHPPFGDEADYQAFFAERLRQLGAEVDLYELDEVPGLSGHPEYMPGRSYSGRPNVFGTFPGTGDGRSLLFSGHADTVYIGAEPWTYGPFSGEVHDDKLYGRGSYDMKGGMAAVLMAVRCLKELGVELAGSVYVESVVDEEHGGANGTLAGRLRSPSADMAIVPEPTNLRICPAHLGGGIWKARFTGKSGIGFNGEELVSALEAAVEYAHLLKRFCNDLNERVERPHWWERTGKTLEVVLLSIVSGDTNRQFQEKLPSTGELNFWIEGYPGMTGEQIIGWLWEFYEQNAAQFPHLVRCRPEITPSIRYLRSSAMEESEAVRRFLNAVRRSGLAALGADPGPEQGAPFACDGFMFNLYSSTPALILGPAGANAHAADEYMDLDSYFKLIVWYAAIMADWCGTIAAKREA